MTLYVTEQEMIERYVDSLKKASSRAVEIIKSDLNKRPKLFIEFIAELKIAAGSTHQLFHSQQNPYWLKIRDTLEKIIEVGETVPPQTAKQNGLWFQIKTALDSMIDRGQKLFIVKPMKTLDVLAEMAIRESKMAKKLEEERKDV
jgi:hypothetical protein